MEWGGYALDMKQSLDEKGKEKETGDKMSNLKSRGKAIGTWALKWGPNVLRSSALGTITWTTYEYAQMNTVTNIKLLTMSRQGQGRDADTAPDINNDDTNASKISWSSSIFHNLAISAVAGGVLAGITHGALWSGSENALLKYYYNRLPDHVEKPLHSVRGTIFSHGISHATLFGSYESSKLLLLSMVHGEESERFDITTWEGGACILLAASISGVASEIVSHYSEPFESYTSWSSLREEMRAIKLPSIRSMGPSAFSTMLGWCAFEFAKDAITPKEQLP